MQKKPPALTLMPRQSRLINAAEGFHLEVISGCLWLTRPNDLTDHFLVAGMSMQLNERGVLIYSDKQPSALSLVPAQYRIVPLKTRSANRLAILTIGWKATYAALIAAVVKI